MFKNKPFQDILNNFISNYSNKNKLFIRNEEIELLTLSLLMNDQQEYLKLKLQDKLFFIKLLKYIKKELESILGRILFLTIREGKYVILDSCYSNWNDWEIESQNRKPDFLKLRDNYFYAKKKLPGIKSLEDFIVIAESLTTNEIKDIFGDEGIFVKDIASRYLSL